MSRKRNQPELVEVFLDTRNLPNHSLLGYETSAETVFKGRHSLILRLKKTAAVPVKAVKKSKATAFPVPDSGVELANG